MSLLRILVGGPVRQDPDILKEYLVSLEELDRAGIEIDYYFIDDNDNCRSKEILAAFVNRNPKTILRDSSLFTLPPAIPYVRDSSHHWKRSLVERVIVFKNDIIRHARGAKYDYLFLIDSDLILNHQTLGHLVKRDVDIVSGVFWTSWDTNSMLVPQVWIQDENELFQQDGDTSISDEDVAQKRKDFINLLKMPGIYEVGGLGACTLISASALQKGVNFDLIDNVSFWGEDRHFCIRARVLGIRLYVDTVMPAFHVYRKELLAGLKTFKKDGFDPNAFVYNALQKNTIARIARIFLRRLKKAGLKGRRIVKLLFQLCLLRKRIVKPSHDLTLSMVVRNEGGRYLREVLEHARKYVDRFVIIDDSSSDKTAEIVRAALEGTIYKLIINDQPLFSNEAVLRKKQWKATLETQPDWILFLDADEICEDEMVRSKKWLLENNSVDAYCFRLFDIWKDGYYRDDNNWSMHKRYSPFMIRYQPKFRYKFKNTRQHCGRMPRNVLMLPYANSPIRIKHLGWLREEDRKVKYNRYKALDPGGKYGDLSQYESILDQEPNLVKY